MIDTDRQTVINAERAKWLSPNEAAQVLNISRSSFDKMLHSGMIPMRREGRTIRIHIDDLRPTTITKKKERYAFEEIPRSQ